MVIVGGNNSLILDETGIVTSYIKVRFYKNVIVLEKPKQFFYLILNFSELNFTDCIWTWHWTGQSQFLYLIITIVNI